MQTNSKSMALTMAPLAQAVLTLETVLVLYTTDYTQTLVTTVYSLQTTVLFQLFERDQ